MDQYSKPVKEQTRRVFKNIHWKKKKKKKKKIRLKIFNFKAQKSLFIAWASFHNEFKCNASWV